MFELSVFEQNGFAITEPFLDSKQIADLVEAIESSAKPSSERGGTRDVIYLAPELRALAEHSMVRNIVEQIIGNEAFVVRATLFDKTDTANWKVPWHQDVTIAVCDRQDVQNYGPWSIKSDVQHVQPPSNILQRMVTVRVHLDPCPQDNGALRVMPGTQELGKLNQNHVEQFVDESKAVCCEVEAGAALVMRPLLLHASSASENPSHRRVVHFDFAIGNLDGDLDWKMRR